MRFTEDTRAEPTADYAAASLTPDILDMLDWIETVHVVDGLHIEKVTTVPFAHLQIGRMIRDLTGCIDAEVG